MRILPEDKEERKWMKVTIFLSFVILLLTIFIFNFLSILSEFIYFSIYCFSFLLLGIFIGIISNLDKKGVFFLCLKSVLILEIIPFSFLILSIFLFGISFVVGMNLFWGVIIMVSAFFCGAGSYIGVSLKEYIKKLLKR